MAGNMETETDTRVDLKGTPANPARDPKKMTDADKSAVGYVALKDAILIIAVAWVIVLFFFFSLRHYNI
ncbi:MAG TPA: hypothetical protein VIY48_12300 [Candidatus Paceibacterota bacterium]|jgi:hypothetical protein